MCFSTSNTVFGTSQESPEVLCENGPEIEQMKELLSAAVDKGYQEIVSDERGMIINGPLEMLIPLLIPQVSAEINQQNFIFSFLLSSRIFIQPHELLGKLIESVPANDESLVHLVVLVGEWTRWFPYDFRGEEIMSLVKHIVAKCGAETQLGDQMSDILSALLIKLTDLSQHEEEMKSYKKSLDEHQIIEWPSSSKLAQLLCHVEKKFAKHIGPEEFVQCSPNLIKEQSNYDVPSFTSIAYPSTSRAAFEMKKKTCNLENYFEWSNRLRRLVANEILQCTNECDRGNKIELWSSVAQHCLLVGNYNSATSILEPICRMQSMWTRFISSKNQQQIACLMKHMEHSQDLNVWNKQTESTCNGIINNTRTSQGHRMVQITSPNSSPLPTYQNNPQTSITKAQQKSKQEWVVLPVFVDIVKLAFKAREDCSTRLPNGSINFHAFNELAAVVSAFTFHMSTISIPLEQNRDWEHLINHIFTSPQRDENELFAEFMKETFTAESYYDLP